MIAFEDEHLLVVRKPAGLNTHSASPYRSEGVFEWLRCREPRWAQLAIVQRLDKETSGLMVVARTLTAQTDLVRQLQARTVKRTYIALVWGRTYDEGTIDAPIGRDARERTRMAVVHTASGKPSRTHFRTLATVPLGRSFVSMVMCKLETGRTHQIRVHLAALGHPIVSDRVYGGGPSRSASATVRAAMAACPSLTARVRRTSSSSFCSAKASHGTSSAFSSVSSRTS